MQMEKSFWSIFIETLVSKVFSFCFVFTAEWNEIWFIYLMSLFVWQPVKFC